MFESRVVNVETFKHFLLTVISTLATFYNKIKLNLKTDAFWSWKQGSDLRNLLEGTPLWL